MAESIRINSQPSIYIAGHKGMVGSAILRNLKKQGFKNIITQSRLKLDLTNQKEVQNFFDHKKLDQVYLAAAKVGGIYANENYPAEFIYQNLMMEANVINSAFRSGVKKLLFLGSSCIYPKHAKQPMVEEALLTGILEPTNEPYAVAKIAGIKLCESFNRQYGVSHGIDYRSVMPTNLYGSADNYHPENSHVIPALIRRFHESKLNNLRTVKIWGTGKQRREFLYVGDMARASIHVMNLDKSLYDKYTNPMMSYINVGSGYDITIYELAQTIKEVVGFNGGILFDINKPDGSPQKLMNSSRLFDSGWRAEIDLKSGLLKTYKDFIKGR